MASLYTLANVDTITRLIPNPIVTTTAYERPMELVRSDFMNGAGPINRNEKAIKKWPAIVMAVGIS
jgi:hypothetical protein